MFQNYLQRQPAMQCACPHVRSCFSSTMHLPDRLPTLQHSRRRVSHNSTGTRNTSRASLLIAHAEQEQETLPPWARKEELEKLAKSQGKDLPFFVYLLLSAVGGITAAGSISEFFAKHALFNKLEPDSPLYLPALAVLILGGLGTTGFCFIRAVDVFNKENENQDNIDGY